MVRRLILLCALALIGLPGAPRAQAPDPLTLDDPALDRWAGLTLAGGDVRDPDEWPAPWRSFEVGSLDDFMAGAGDFSRVFPSPGRRMAAVVTWSRPKDPGRRGEVTARASLRDAAGTERAAFAVEALTGFDVTDDGSALVAHGATMSRVIACGALQTSLAFYAADGRLVARVERNDFSPAYATALLASPPRLVLGVTGRVEAYDLETGRRAWQHALGVGDRPRLMGGEEDLYLSVTPPAGPTRLLRLDAAGSEQAASTFSGRITPGSGMARTGDRLVIHESSPSGSTLHVVDARTLRSLRRMVRWETEARR